MASRGRDKSKRVGATVGPQGIRRPAAAKGPVRPNLAARKQRAAHGSPFAGLTPNAANFSPLTPVSFLPRTAAIHPDRTAVVHGTRRYTYRQLHERARRLASALARYGIRAGDTVSVMLPNVPAMVEAHFGVPMLGAVLNTINTRLDPATIAYILDHGEAKVLVTDRELAGSRPRSGAVEAAAARRRR
jgi:fatty-acyl-CoA synthase